jgi:hypothetical protein
MAFRYPDRARAGDDWDVWTTAARYGALREALLRAGAAPAALPADPGVGDSDRRNLPLRAAGRHVLLTVGGAGRSIAAFVEHGTDGAAADVLPGLRVPVATAAALMLIKRGHLYDPARWHVHVADYHFLRERVRESDVSDALRAAAAARAREWVREHPDDQGSGSMRIPNEAFFAGTRVAQIRAYEHDDLHRATCYGDEPLYRSLKDDPSLAYVSGRRFERMSHLDKVRLVREEAFAIALERVVVPSLELGRPFDAGRAFRYALCRIATDLTKGWFRDFAIEHYPEVSRVDVDFVAKFLDALARGRVRRKPPAPGPLAWEERMRAQLDEIARVDERTALA